MYIRLSPKRMLLGINYSEMEGQCIQLRVVVVVVEMDVVVVECGDGVW